MRRERGQGLVRWDMNVQVSSTGHKGRYKGDRPLWSQVVVLQLHFPHRDISREGRLTCRVSRRQTQQREMVAAAKHSEHAWATGNDGDRLGRADALEVGEPERTMKSAKGPASVLARGPGWETWMSLQRQAEGWSGGWGQSQCVGAGEGTSP